LPKIAAEEIPLPATRIYSGSTFEREIGYARAVVSGDLVFVSGTTGFHYDSMSITDDVVKQCEQALRNIDWALEKSGASMKDVVRVRYILPERDDFPLCWPLLREAFGGAAPAATMLVAGLSDVRMKIEIEVTARVRTTATAK
jgi:enamine deaminase RidA (YjgF/YER057c/UK114 family)